MTAAYSAGDDLFLAHVGHSRAYVYRDGELTQLTSDDTVAERLAQMPARPAAGRSPTEDLRHILTDTVGGTNGPPVVQTAHFRIWDGDYILLCTDGLTSQVSDDRIAEVLALRRRLDQQCETLIDLALQRGGRITSRSCSASTGPHGREGQSPVKVTKCRDGAAGNGEDLSRPRRHCFCLA